MVRAKPISRTKITSWHTTPLKGQRWIDADTVGWIADVLAEPADQALRARVRTETHGLCHRFPIYPELSAS